MKIHLYVNWYERKPDCEPDYDKEHHIIIEGETPKECMDQLQVIRDNHNVVKYTPTQILYIF